MKQYKMVQVESEKSVLKVILNRPEKANAINIQMLKELNEIISDVRNNQECKFIVFTGSGKHFSGGADMKEFMSIIENNPSNSSWIRNYHLELQEFHRKLEALDQITIAAINGAMYGGGLALALCCDFRFIAKDAKVCIPEVDRGMFFATGCIPRMVNLVGSSTTKELVIMADVIDANEALKIGLVNEIVTADELFSKIDEMIEKLDSKPFLPIRLTKKIANSSTTSVDRVSLWESELFEYSLNIGSIKDGVGDFVNR
jgi:enoyl-CoA hydratase/carnithine racemase